MFNLSKYGIFLVITLALLSACSTQKEPKSSSEALKPKLILINKSADGNYYTDKRTQAQVFAPTGMKLDMKSQWLGWGENFLLKNAANDFNIFIRFDKTTADDEEMSVCKQLLLESPIAGLDSSKMKVYPFLKGEFNADTIVTTDKIYPLSSPDRLDAKANLFQIRKTGLGCYSFLFIYANDTSLATYSTEKEILEYVRFE